MVILIGLNQVIRHFNLLRFHKFVPHLYLNDLAENKTILKLEFNY